jgi:transcriptional regulator with XRE-family HTH domain
MNLKHLRERAGCGTQEEAAALVGVDQTTISKLEAGNVPSPRLDTLQKLATGYGVELSVVVAAVRASVSEAA